MNKHIKVIDRYGTKFSTAEVFFDLEKKRFLIIERISTRRIYDNGILKEHMVLILDNEDYETESKYFHKVKCLDSLSGYLKKCPRLKKYFKKIKNKNVIIIKTDKNEINQEACSECPKYRIVCKICYCICKRTH